MTRQENTGIRDLTFSGWVRENLPNSATGFMVTDIDFYMYNYKTKKHLLVEVKNNNAPLKKWQSIMYKNLSHWIDSAAKKDGWDFKGFYFIKFVKTSFKDGVYLNDKISSEEEIIKKLSLE